MLVDEEGRFITQRVVPALSGVEVRLTSRGIQVCVPGRPVVDRETPDGEESRVRVTVWKDTVDAIPVASVIDEWLSHYLGRSVRLMFMPETARRGLDPDYGETEDDVSFADGYPVLLISQASLDDLNNRLDLPIPMNRFRPNLVVTGCEPFEEDLWKVIRIGSMRFRVVKPCARCMITTIDQETGVSGIEPLRTLASYRQVTNKVMFGQNLIPDGPFPATIRQGDELVVET